MRNFRRATVVVLCLFSLTQIYTQTLDNQTLTPLSTRREMRGLWVATVNNIDWPSSPGLTADELQKETIAILDKAVEVRLNPIFLHVRPSADAIYRSSLEPPTTYLVDERRNALEVYDPLEFWIAEAHRRGLELHAWINPFRVTPKKDFACRADHMSRTKSDWLVTYAEKLYLNPGLPEARNYICNVVVDIARRYDVDGIHFDDYFYPYPVKNQTFDDARSYTQNNSDGLELGDWRRQNVDYVIKQVADTLRDMKPWVSFGISPFGVWRNRADDARGSSTFAGITDYDVLFADVVKWAEKGWVDYVIPQIYWESGNRAADFDHLTQWWSGLATKQTQIFVGHAVFKINASNKAWENPSEIPSQIVKVRENTALDGSVFFSYRQFNRDILGLEHQLKDNLYNHHALTSLRAAGEAGEIEIKNLKKRKDSLTWSAVGDTANVRFYAVYRYKKGEQFDQSDNEKLFAIVGEPQMALSPAATKREKYVYRVSAVDKFRREHAVSDKITVLQ